MLLCFHVSPTSSSQLPLSLMFLSDLVNYPALKEQSARFLLCRFLKKNSDMVKKCFVSLCRWMPLVASVFQRCCLGLISPSIHDFIYCLDPFCLMLFLFILRMQSSYSATLKVAHVSNVTLLTVTFSCALWYSKFLCTGTFDICTSVQSIAICKRRTGIIIGTKLFWLSPGRSAQ